MEKLRFLTPSLIHHIRAQYETPLFVYSERILREQAEKVLTFPHAFWFTPRYAMKANSNKNILRLFSSLGIKIDASSGYEVERALSAGIAPTDIQLTGQEIPKNLEDIVHSGVEFNTTSLHQLEVYGSCFPQTEVSIRVNPWLGSGGTSRTNVGGPASSFGIWHAYLEEAKSIAEKYGLTITKIHSHIGSGSDPEVWKRVASMVLAIGEKIPSVQRISLGGGYKVGRMEYEKTADLSEIWEHVRVLFQDFASKTGRNLDLEIEPGTFLVANAWSLITEVIDVVDTGSEWYRFIKINTGMTEVTRPSLYGAQHPIVVVGNSEESDDFIVVGHNCESGDIFTPAPWDPEGLLPRTLLKPIIGDSLIVEWVGAYCSSMSTHGYNSFPEAGELLLKESGELVEIRKRAKSQELWSNEI